MQGGSDAGGGIQAVSDRAGAGRGSSGSACGVVRSQCCSDLLQVPESQGGLMKKMR